MTDTNNSGEKTWARPRSRRLHLKRPVEQGTVRQSFSHGRSKAVVVEKVKRRVLGPGEAPPRAAAPGVLRRPPPRPPRRLRPQRRARRRRRRRRRAPWADARAARADLTVAPPKTGVVLHTLTEEQREARARALVDARAREEEDRRRQEADAAVAPRARSARTDRARSRRSAQARGRAAPRAGSQLQAPDRR